MFLSSEVGVVAVVVVAEELLLDEAAELEPVATVVPGSVGATTEGCSEGEVGTEGTVVSLDGAVVVPVFGDTAGTVVSVSYTHLDVYKRQS